MENVSMERTLMVNSEGNYTCEVSNLDGVNTQTSMVFCKYLYSKRNATKFVPKVGSYATIQEGEGEGSQSMAISKNLLYSNGKDSTVG